jgi:hypothetical protein
MRFVEGHDLEAVLADGPLEPGRAVRVIEQVAKALQAAPGQPDAASPSPQARSSACPVVLHVSSTSCGLTTGASSTIRGRCCAVC